MKKTFVVCAIAMLAGCNLFRKDEAAADGGAPSTSSSSTTTSATTPQSIVDKALSFVSGTAPFEGEVTMSDTSSKGATAADKTMTIVYQVKGDKMRFNAPSERSGENAYVIFESGTKTMTTVSDAKKTAMVMNMNSGPMAAKVAAAQAAKPDVQKSSTDTVAGYSCDVYKITEANGDKSEACLAKGIRFPQMGKGNASWLGAIGEDMFPMRVVTTDAAGKEKNRMEVTKVEKKKLDDALFTVPAGYKVMNMDDLMKSLGGAGMPHM